MIINFFDEYDECVFRGLTDHAPRIGETVIIDDNSYFVKNVVHEFSSSQIGAAELNIILSEMPQREKTAITISAPINESAKAEQLANKALKEVKTLRNDFLNLRGYIQRQQHNKEK